VTGGSERLRSINGNGLGAEQVQPSFSRRIGLSEDARAQSIDRGATFTGQTEGQDLGFRQVRTGTDEHAGSLALNGRFETDGFYSAPACRRSLASPCEAGHDTSSA
jgi:hypothetical protein